MAFNHSCVFFYITFRFMFEFRFKGSYCLKGPAMLLLLIWLVFLRWRFLFLVKKNSLIYHDDNQDKSRCYVADHTQPMTIQISFGVHFPTHTFIFIRATRCCWYRKNVFLSASAHFDTQLKKFYYSFLTIYPISTIYIIFRSKNTLHISL